MTMTVDQIWREYREGSGGMNHDGTFELPENVRNLPESSQMGYQQITHASNRHASEAYQEGRKRGHEEGREDKGREDARWQREAQRWFDAAKRWQEEAQRWWEEQGRSATAPVVRQSLMHPPPSKETRR